MLVYEFVSMETYCIVKYDILHYYGFRDMKITPTFFLNFLKSFLNTPEVVEIMDTVQAYIYCWDDLNDIWLSVLTEVTDVIKKALKICISYIGELYNFVPIWCKNTLILLSRNQFHTHTHSKKIHRF